MSACYYMAAYLSKVKGGTYVVAGTSNACEFGIGLPDDIELEIESLYFDSEPIRANWDEIGEKYTNDNIIDEYIQTAMSHVDVDAIKEANLKVVLDCGSGAGSFTAPYLVRELGCEVTTLNCQADGNVIFSPENPKTEGYKYK